MKCILNQQIFLVCMQKSCLIKYQILKQINIRKLFAIIFNKKHENKLNKLSQTYDKHDNQSFDPWTSTEIEIEQLQRMKQYDYRNMGYNPDAYNNTAIESLENHTLLQKNTTP